MLGAVVLAAALSGAAAWACIRSPPAAVLRRRLGPSSAGMAPPAAAPLGLGSRSAAFGLEPRSAVRSARRPGARARPPGPWAL